VGQIAQRLIGKVGMLLGIAVIVASAVGGIVLSADLGRGEDQTDTGVPVSNEGAVPPGGTATAGPTVSASEPAPTVSTPPPLDGDDSESTNAPPGGPATTRAPEATPTCWEGDGERPDGIEKCEDDD
jgi:hypothetical protein